MSRQFIKGGRGPTDNTPLRNSVEVANEIAKIYRAAKSGKLQLADATKLTFILTSLNRVLETGVLEQRLSALEAEYEHL